MSPGMQLPKVYLSKINVPGQTHSFQSWNCLRFWHWTELFATQLLLKATQAALESMKFLILVLNLVNVWFALPGELLLRDPAPDGLPEAVLGIDIESVYPMLRAGGIRYSSTWHMLDKMSKKLSWNEHLASSALYISYILRLEDTDIEKALLIRESLSNNDPDHPGKQAKTLSCLHALAQAYRFKRRSCVLLPNWLMNAYVELLLRSHLKEWEDCHIFANFCDVGFGYSYSNKYQFIYHYQESAFKHYV